MPIPVFDVQRNAFVPISPDVLLLLGKTEEITRLDTWQLFHLLCVTKQVWQWKLNDGDDLDEN